MPPKQKLLAPACGSRIPIGRVRTVVSAGLLVAALCLTSATYLTLPRETLLAGFVTPLAGRKASQRHNAALAAQRLNGANIPAGAVFSFNRRVGSFSRDEGYRKAPVSYNGQLIDDWGGGVCQVSTTLYNAALLSNLQIVERNRHRFCPSYVPPGRDAAVAFSDIDLRFRNTHPYPIKIRARADDGFVHVEIWGPQPVQRRPQVVEVLEQVERPETFTLGQPAPAARVRNSGRLGYDVSVFRINGQTRELISHDTYPANNRVIDYR